MGRDKDEDGRLGELKGREHQEENTRTSEGLRKEMWALDHRGSPFFCFCFFFANRTVTLKGTNEQSILKKEKKYNEIFEKLFVFNLQPVSTTRCRCRSSKSRSDIVGCGREVTERAKKTTSFSMAKKKEELPNP
jgi:hypothetical protein